MKNLRNSIILLLSYLFLVLGLAQIRYFEVNVLYFQAAFFIMMTIAVFLGVLPLGRFHLPMYGALLVWMIMYLLIWIFVWSKQASPPSPSELVIQFLLLQVAAGLSHNVGSHLIEFDVLFDNLSNNMYPNRTLEMNSATDRIQTEITRSRRYSRPLSVLMFQLLKPDKEQYRQQLDRLETDLFQRFALAKAGHIINSHARQTDLIMRDETGRFVILCPETDSQDCQILAQRIRNAVQTNLSENLAWGIASFPQHTLEFDSLLKQAASDLHSPDTFPEPRPGQDKIEDEPPVS